MAEMNMEGTLGNNIYKSQFAATQRSSLDNRPLDNDQHLVDNNFDTGVWSPSHEFEQFLTRQEKCFADPVPTTTTSSGLWDGVGGSEKRTDLFGTLRNPGILADDASFSGLRQVGLSR